MKKDGYSSPYLAGIGLGISLLLAFIIMGRGLGASGALMRTVVATEKVISQEHVDNNEYLAKYGGGDKNPLDNWLVFELLGVIAGAIISGALAGRLRRETNHGPRITNNKRWMFALIGGTLAGFGARLAKGCASGQALTGGSTMVLGSWIFLICFFAGGFAVAYFMRKQWI